MGIEANIVPGKILYIRVPLPPSYDEIKKYMVIVVTGEYPLLLKINSEGEQSDIAKKNHEVQLTLKNTVYSFLKDTSYLDCGTVWHNLISTTEIIRQIETDPTLVMGDITEDHKRDVVRLTALSKSISTIDKRKINEALGKKKPGPGDGLFS